MKDDIINKLHIANSVEFMRDRMDRDSIDITVTSPLKTFAGE
ncbi:MAG: hypothetical protein U9Q97_06785 [Acidobacteriota bacterium]|nr:hypothetical protein [Acidobacteriota bacterium]